MTTILGLVLAVCLLLSPSYFSHPGIDEEDNDNNVFSTHQGGNLIGCKNMLPAVFEDFVLDDNSGSSL